MKEREESQRFIVLKRLLKETIVGEHSANVETTACLIEAGKYHGSPLLPPKIFITDEEAEILASHFSHDAEIWDLWLENIPQAQIKIGTILGGVWNCLSILSFLRD